MVDFSLFLQRFAQVASLEPLLQFEEHKAALAEDEGHAGVFRTVS